MQNSIVMFSFFVFGRKYFVWDNLFQKIKVFERKRTYWANLVEIVNICSFFVFDQKCSCQGKFGPKCQSCQFKAKFASYNLLQNIFGIQQVSLKVLILSESLTLLFGYFRQDNYKIQFLARGLGSRLQFELFIFFHPKSLIS